MRFLATLSVKAKLVLSSLVFSLPIAVLLYSAAAGIGANISFAALERTGNAYQGKVAAVMQALVITSYSIHYTKLYDAFWIRRSTSRALSK